MLKLLNFGKDVIVIKDFQLKRTLIEIYSLKHCPCQWVRFLVHYYISLSLELEFYIIQFTFGHPGVI